MNNMDIMLVLLLILLAMLHILFCYRAVTSAAHITNVKRWIWGACSLFMGPLGYYAFQNCLPLDSLE